MRPSTHALAGLALVATVALSACGSSSGSGAGSGTATRYGGGAAASTAKSAPGPAATATVVSPAAGSTGAGSTGAGSTAAGADPYGAGPASSSAASATVVAVAHTGLGDVLVDGQGRTLYAFTKDTAGQPSACSGACAAAWPAVVGAGPAAGAGVDASKLTTVAAADGTKQVAYAGHLLYRYAKDANPGDTVGQKVGGVWFVVAPSGALVGA